jgi:hypothetical protein
MKSTTGMTELVCVRPGGERVTVTVAVGHPYPTTAGDWACPLEISGLHGRLKDIVGIDSLQALTLAIRMARDLLSSFGADGGRILDPRTGVEANLDIHFSSTPPRPK